MSHVTHPYGYRLVTLRPWQSSWFARDTEYRDFLRGDVLLREYLIKRLRSVYLSTVTIERDRNMMKVNLHTSRPGLLIGRSGEGIKKIRDDITVFATRNKLKLPKDIKVDVVDVQVPEQDAQTVGLMIAQDLERRQPFKRIMKIYAEKILNTRGVRGVRIVLSGRLGGADMSRREEVKLGSIPLQFIRADIDYAVQRATMTYGVIGIKVWIYKGDSLVSELERMNETRRA